jgi:hypothetical protein
VVVKINSEYTAKHVSHLLTKHLARSLHKQSIYQVPEALTVTIEAHAKVHIKFTDEYRQVFTVTPWDNEIDYGYTVASMDDIIDLWIEGKLIPPKEVENGTVGDPANAG